MSIFRCKVCDLEYDSDFNEMNKIDDLDVCEDCFSEKRICNKPDILVTGELVKRYATDLLIKGKIK